MRNVVVILRCGAGETERLREGLRLYAGLVAGGLDAAAVIEGDAVSALADEALAEERAMLVDAGIPLLIDDRQRIGDVLNSRISACLRPVATSEITDRLACSEGRIVFHPTIET